MSWVGFYFHPSPESGADERVVVMLPEEYQYLLCKEFIQGNLRDIILKHFPEAIIDSQGEIDIGMLGSGASTTLTNLTKRK